MNEKEYTKQFLDKCKNLNLKSTKKDEDGIPTLYPNAKKNPWFCQPWGNNKAALHVFDAELAAKGDTLHGKTIRATLRKFLKYVPDYRSKIDDIDDPGTLGRLESEGLRFLCGDTEGIIVFPLDKLGKVARHFGFNKKKATAAQLAHRAKFGQMMKERKEKENGNS